MDTNISIYDHGTDRRWHRLSGVLVALTMMASASSRAATIPGTGEPHGPVIATENMAPAGQEALGPALHAARHEVAALTEAETAMPRNRGVRFFASNPGQRLTARFLDGAVRIEPGRDGHWAGTLRYPADGDPAEPAAPVAADNRVDYYHPGGITEWYLNRGDGIEHGFTVAEKPAGTADAGDLRVEVGLEGLVARARPSGSTSADALDFIDPATGRRVLRYAGLIVWDADGIAVPASLEPTHSGFAIVAADAGATYPMTIDPLILAGESILRPEFPGGDGSPEDGFGYFAALSGATAVVCAPSDATLTGYGSAYIFARSEDGWTRQARFAAPAVLAGDTALNGSVAIDGDTVILGGTTLLPARDEFSSQPVEGYALVMSREGDTWAVEVVLAAPTPLLDDGFGTSVALSGDNVLVAAPGGPIIRDDVVEIVPGRVYAFERTGSDWNHTGTIEAPAQGEFDGFGSPMALAGTAAAVAGYSDSGGYVRVYTRAGDSWTSQGELQPSGEPDWSFYADSLALEGDSLVIGSSNRTTDAGEAAGRAYVFVRTGSDWVQQATLDAPDLVANDNFGRSVAISGDTVLVGTDLDGFNSSGNGGARTYVFERSGATWPLATTIEAGLRPGQFGFGTTVAISGDTALIGTFYEWGGLGGSDPGKAYVFVRDGSGWIEEAVLTPGDAGAGDSFGETLAISGETLAVGMPSDDTPAGRDVGSVYVFAREGSTWLLQAKLGAEIPTANGRFGAFLTLSGDTVVVGGSVPFAAARPHVFERTGSEWNLQARIEPEELLPGFGWPVALSGDTLLVGRSSDGGGFFPSDYQGQAYVFVRDGSEWKLQAVLEPDDGRPDERFGTALAVSGNHALVGTVHSQSALGENVHVFVREGIAWSREATLTSGTSAPYGTLQGSIALDADTALVGARNETAAGVPGAGIVVVYVRDGGSWVEQARLQSNQPSRFAGFGERVALAGNLALVGEPGSFSAVGYVTNAVYLFHRIGPGWALHQKLEASGLGAVYPFGTVPGLGRAVALDGTTAVVAETGYYSTHPVTGDPIRHVGQVHIFQVRADSDATVAVEHHGEVVAVQCIGTPGVSYEVEWSTDLENWDLLLRLVAPSSGRFEYQFAPPGPFAYYRLREQ